jgi:3-oxoacyl-[acyl-carrier-protein] synthase II
MPIRQQNRNPNLADRRVVISGLGVLSPLGLSVAHYWNALLAGHSGIRCIQGFNASSLPTRIAGEIIDFRPEDYIEKRKSIKIMGRHIQMAVAAARLAAEDAGLDQGGVDPSRLGVSMGTGMLHADLQELQSVILASIDKDGALSYELLGCEAPNFVFPLWLLKYIPNMTASHISIFQNAQGPSNTITT